ncbi:MAG TPA: sigma-70 family RNA polymerase sigma factor [Acidimicrobiales bacterium]|nr:sigma-70 family RNA polymerase sigma factor [Acidimicrobiales bacterium]
MGVLSTQGESGPIAGPDGFTELYLRWRPDVVTLCGRLLGRHADAEDAAQDAFLRAWLARDQYSSTKPFWPWLSTITRRLCIDRRRRQAPDPVETADLEGDIIVTTPELSVVAGEELQAVLSALTDLRAAERRALVLREFAGWSYQQIATVDGVTVESVRASIKRARANLRRAVLSSDGSATP